jgi:hypothetical protein
MSSVCDISVKNKPLVRLSERAPVRPTGVVSQLRLIRPTRSKGCQVSPQFVDLPKSRAPVRRQSRSLCGDQQCLDSSNRWTTSVTSGGRWTEPCSLMWPGPDGSSRSDIGSHLVTRLIRVTNGFQAAEAAEKSTSR